MYFRSRFLFLRATPNTFLNEEITRGAAQDNVSVTIPCDTLEVVNGERDFTREEVHPWRPHMNIRVTS